MRAAACASRPGFSAGSKMKAVVAAVSVRPAENQGQGQGQGQGQACRRVIRVRAGHDQGQGQARRVVDGSQRGRWWPQA